MCDRVWNMQPVHIYSRVFCLNGQWPVIALTLTVSHRWCFNLWINRWWRPNLHAPGASMNSQISGIRTSSSTKEVLFGSCECCHLGQRLWTPMPSVNCHWESIGWLQKCGCAGHWWLLQFTVYCFATWSNTFNIIQASDLFCSLSGSIYVFNYNVSVVFYVYAMSFIVFNVFTVHKELS